MNNRLAIACALSLTLVAPVFAEGKNPSRKEIPNPKYNPSQKQLDESWPRDPRSAVLLPGMHGEGTGTWRPAAKLPGRLRAISVAEGKGPTFGFDAAITRVHEKGSTEIRGTFLGEMLLIDPKQGAHAVAMIAGEWSQDADGRGAFMGHILVPTGDREEPFEAVGRIVGPFEVPNPDLKGSQKGTVTLRWDVSL
jgi:hypothetical protein